MFNEEIIKLHKRLDERAMKRDSNVDDNHLSQLGETHGWDVLKGDMESMMAELLRPVDFEDSVSLDVRGAIGEARKFGIDVLEIVIRRVEATKAAKRHEKELKKQSEDNA